MKTSKKLLAVLCAGAVTLSAGAFAACDKTPAHDHNDHLTYITEGFVTHYGKCSEDDYKTESENHTFGTDNKCDKCGQAKKIDVASVTVAGEDSVKVGENISLTATVTPANASEKSVSWKITSGSEYAALGASGVLTGVAPGSVTVTATADGVSGSKTVTVVPAAYLAQAYVCIDDTGEGNTAQIAVSAGASEAVEAVSKNPEIATATYADGRLTVTAVKAGKAAVEVSVGSDKEELTVEVATAGLTYEYMMSDGGDEYIQVSDGAERTSTEVYIPGYRFSEEANEGEGAYLPITTIKSAPTADGAIFEANGGGFQSSNITTIYTGDNVSVIGGRAFESCLSLTTVTCGVNLRHIMGYAFAQSTVTTIDLTEMVNLTKIDRAAFRTCPELTEITVPVNVEGLGDAVCEMCPKLSKIRILSTKLKMIYGMAFMEQKGEVDLELWLPANVTSIAKDSFGSQWTGKNKSIVVYYSGTEAEYKAIEYFESSFDTSKGNLDPNESHCTVHYECDFAEMLNPTPAE